MSHFSERDMLVFFSDISTIEKVKQAMSKFKNAVRITKPSMGVLIVVTGMKQLSKLKKDPIFQSYSSSEPFEKFIEGRFLAHANLTQELKLFTIINHSKSITEEILKKLGNHMKIQYKDELLDIVI